MKFSKNTLFRLFRIFPSIYSASFWLLMTSGLTNLFSLAIPIFFLQVYDRILVYKGQNSLVWISLGIVVVILADMVIRISQGDLSDNYAENFAFKQEQKLMEKIYSLAGHDFQKEDQAGWIRKFQSIANLKSFYSNVFFQSLLDLPFLGLFLWAVFFYGGAIIYFHLLILAIFTIVQFIFQPVLRRSLLARMKVEEAQVENLNEQLSRIHFVKAQALEELMLRKMEGIQAEYSYIHKEDNKRKELYQFISNLLGQILIYGSICIGGYFIIQGHLSIGIVTAVTMLSRRIIGPMQSFARFLSLLSQASVDLKNIEIEQHEKPISFKKIDFKKNISGNLELRNVSHQKIKDITLQVPIGQITNIIPEDEAAADILADLLTGIQKPEFGDIILDSYILSNLKGLYSSDELAFLPRKGILFNGTILENITFFNANLTVPALDAGALLKLDKSLSVFPKGFETEVKTYSNNTLSAGVIQRIAIARSFVYRPKIIISDRCEELMDDASLTAFISLLMNLRKSTAILLISNNTQLVQMADAVFTLRDGRLCEGALL